jgi:hypothetical protein
MYEESAKYYTPIVYQDSFLTSPKTVSNPSLRVALPPGRKDFAMEKDTSPEQRTILHTVESPFTQATSNGGLLNEQICRSRACLY